MEKLALEEFFSLPWPNIAAFFGACIGALTLFSMVAPKAGRIRRAIGNNIQEMLGIADLRGDVEAIDIWRVNHVNEAQRRDQAITDLALTINQYVRKDNRGPEP